MKPRYSPSEAHLEPQPVDRVLGLLVNFGKVCLILLLVPVVWEVCQLPKAEQEAQLQKLNVLYQEKAALSAVCEKLKRQIGWIKTDTAYLEMRARDHENMQKKGEYVIRIE
jgi:cell division protein FtsB